MSNTFTHFATPILLLMGAISGSVAAAQPTTAEKNGTYRMLAYDQCKLVADVPLNETQIKHYQAMQDIEDNMQYAQHSLQRAETQMSALSLKLEELTQLAEQQNHEHWQADSKTIAKIEAISQQIDDVVNTHQPQFAHLESTASQVEKIANQFEQAISGSLIGLTFQQVEILTPNKPTSQFKCRHTTVVKS